MAVENKDNGAQGFLKNNFSYFPNGEGEGQYEGVSAQNEPKENSILPDNGAPTINIGLSQDDKDKLELARKQAEAVMPLDVLTNEIRRQASQYTPESEEERKKRERRERSKKIIGAVTDGLSALGNLYFTTQYAPNMYNHEKQSQLAAVNRWADKLKADREARRDRYDALQGKIGQLGLEKARTVREIEAAHEQQKIARERARREEEEAKRKAKMFEPQYQEALSKAEGAGYDAQTKKALADAAPEQQSLKTENLRKQGDVYDSTIRKNNAQTYKYYNGTGNGNGSGKTYDLELEEGPESYGTPQEYDANVKYWATEYKIPLKKRIIVKENNYTQPETKIVDRSNDELAADIKREALRRREEKKNNKKPLPGQETGKRKLP